MALPALMKPSGDTEEEFSGDEFRPRTECYVSLAAELRDEGRFHEGCEKIERRAPKQCEARLELAAAGDETRIATGEVARRLRRAVHAPGLGGSLQPLQNEIISREKLEQALLALLPEQEKRQLLQTGEIDTAFSDRLQERCRLNIYRLGNGYAAAIRLLPKDIPDCNSLGLPQIISQLAGSSSGLLLVTGATGSGKSTTLAALVQQINQTRAVHILTLEDPIEYVYPAGLALINQREVGRDTRSFASGLRSALRQDPDVIMVGELRDAETIGIALTAAETGHLVLATLHTQDAAGTVNRILDVLPDRQHVCTQLADCLLGICCQRLLPRCDAVGRAAAFEVLVATPAMRNLIREGRTHQLQSYLQTGARYGMQTMEDAVKALQLRGIIA